MFFGGTWQIRTAVHGFADRYLATRSRYPLQFPNAKVMTFLPIYQKKSIIFFTLTKNRLKQ